MDGNKTEMGMHVYESICAVLDEMGIRYDKDDEKLVTFFGYKGDDMNHNLLIAVNAQQEAIQLMEKMPYEIDPEKTDEVAKAVCRVNSNLLVGGFTYRLGDSLAFEMTQLYSGSLIGKAMLERMIIMLIKTVEAYDDKFMALNKGYLTSENFEG